MLLEKYPYIINQRNDNRETGFMFACGNDCLEVVELLLDKYPDIINQKSKNGCTGFIYAC